MFNFQTQAVATSSLGKAKAARSMFGKKSSFLIEEFDPEKEYSQAAFLNGIWECRTTFVGKFTYKKADAILPGLSKLCEPSFHLSMKKIPYSAYTAILSFFQLVAKRFSDEVIVQVFFNKTTEQYELHVPNQTVSGASISFKRDEGPMIDPNLIWVMDVHSHVNMNAFWSSQDSRDEVSTRLFGVIGKVSSTPEYRFRAGCNGNFLDIDINDIFDRESSMQYSIDLSSLDKVKQQRFEPPSFIMNTFPNNGNVFGSSNVRSTMGNGLYPRNLSKQPQLNGNRIFGKNSDLAIYDDYQNYDFDLGHGFDASYYEDLNEYEIQQVREACALSEGLQAKNICADVLTDLISFLEDHKDMAANFDQMIPDTELLELFYKRMSTGL